MTLCICTWNVHGMKFITKRTADSATITHSQLIQQSETQVITCDRVKLFEENFPLHFIYVNQQRRSFQARLNMIDNVSLFGLIIIIQS